jgi:hypothetical protein
MATGLRAAGSGAATARLRGSLQREKPVPSAAASTTNLGDSSRA